MRIYYDDTDAGGIVYHANYLKYCERARSELFFEQGRMPTLEGAHFVVKHIDAEFLRPAKLGDMIDVRYRVLKLKGVSMVLYQSIWLDEIKLFEMRSTLVYAKDGRPARIDKDTREFLESLAREESFA